MNQKQCNTSASSEENKFEQEMSLQSSKRKR